MTVVTPPRTEPAAAPARPVRVRRRAPFAHRLGRTVTMLVLVLGALLTLFPFYAMVVLSLKPEGGIEIPRSLLPVSLTTEQYERIFGAEGVLRWLLNTLIYSVVGVVFVLLLCSLAGYGFAKSGSPAGR
jgi:multiple sugar transport system permease protein